MTESYDYFRRYDTVYREIPSEESTVSRLKRFALKAFGIKLPAPTRRVAVRTERINFYGMDDYKARPVWGSEDCCTIMSVARLLAV